MLSRRHKQSNRRLNPGADDARGNWTTNDDAAIRGIENGGEDSDMKSSIFAATAAFAQGCLTSNADRKSVAFATE